MKTLKIWNGRAPSAQGGSIYVAAYTNKQAIEIVNKAFNSRINMDELYNYWSKGSWGNSMEGIKPENPCVYYSKRSFQGEKPKLIFELK